MEHLDCVVGKDCLDKMAVTESLARKESKACREKWEQEESKEALEGME